MTFLGAVFYFYYTLKNGVNVSIALTLVLMKCVANAVVAGLCAMPHMF